MGATTVSETNEIRASPPDHNERRNAPSEVLIYFSATGEPLYSSAVLWLYSAHWPHFLRERIA
jgi:hypothetical protein